MTRHSNISTNGSAGVNWETNVLRLMGPVLAALATLLSMIIVIAWTTDSLRIASISAKFIPMAPTTAICFTLLGVVLLCRQWRTGDRTLQGVRLFLTGMVLLFSVAIVLQFILVSATKVVLDIEGWITPALLSEHGYVIGRMSPLTALLFALLAAAMLLSASVDNGDRGRDRLAQGAAAVVFTVSDTLLVGYWYGAPLLYGGTFTPVAATTSIAFILVSTAFLFESKKALLARWVMSPSVFSRFTRMVIPGTMGIILVVGWVQTSVLTRLRAVDQVLSFTLSALLTACLIGVLAVIVARQVQTAVTRAEGGLRDSEQKLRRFYESNLQGVIYWNMNGQIVDANDKFLQMVGYSREELIAGKIDWVNMTPPEYRVVDEQSVLELRTAGANEKPFEKVYIRKDGTRLPIIIAGTMLDEARLNGVAFVLDITDRKQVEARLARANRALKMLNACNGIAIHADNEERLLKDTCNRIVEVGEYKLAWVGYAEDDEHKSVRPVALAGTDGDYVEHADISWGDNERGRGPTGTCIRTGEIVINRNTSTQLHYDPWHSRATEKGYVSSATFPLCVGDRVYGALMVYSGISDAFDDEETELLAEVANDMAYSAVALRERSARVEAEERYRSTLDSMLEGCQIVGHDFRYLYLNDVAVQQSHISKDHLLGRTMMEVYPGIETTEMFSTLKRCMSNKAPGHLQNEFVYPDGARSWFNLSFEPVPEGVFILSEDITEDRRLAEEAKKYHEHLEELVEERTIELTATNKELEAFSYSVSHDLRAPLRSIDGFSLALLEDYAPKLDDRAKDYIGRVRGASQSMAVLIDDLLQLSRMTRRELHIENVDLTSMAHRVIGDLRQGEPGRPVEFTVMPNLMISGDANLLRIVLVNLLGNAWKFTSRKPMARIEFGKIQKQGETVFIVHDNGAGFDPKYSDKLFTPFQRLHNTSEFPGTGIGLATVQRIVRRHGGRVWAEAEINEGATFFFTLKGIEKP